MDDLGHLPDDAERVLDALQEVRHAVVPETLHGQRIDRVFAQLVPEFSRSYLQQLIEQGLSLIHI
jgi:23S rRNA pseudouridine1911/1915/1917 synthase